MIKQNDFIATAEKIYTFPTLYVSGGFGAVATDRNKSRYVDYNKYDREHRQEIIDAPSDTSFFDCVGLVKSIIWGWKGDLSKTYGGAIYNSNGLNDSDVSASKIIKYCTDVSEDFSTIEPGELVWQVKNSKGRWDDHVGIYVGGGIVIESTSKWEAKVQKSMISNEFAPRPKKALDKTRTWHKHGKLSLWVEYDSEKPFIVCPYCGKKIELDI